jgi:hypothetical protein
MSIIERTLQYRGSKGQAELVTLFDSGASYSCINPAIAPTLGSVEPLPEPFDLGTASEGTFLRVENRVVLNFYLNDLRLSDEFMVVPGLADQAIIGASTMQKWKIKLDFEHDQVITDPRVAKLRLI